MIDTVIFDIGKVLMGYSWEKYLHSIVGEDKIAYATLEPVSYTHLTLPTT